MALDHALMDRARRTGECVFRVYTWSRPTLSFGRHQAVRGRVDPAAAAALGVDLVRRPTGGRALLHHREVTYSVTAPLGAGDSVREWYGAINSVLLVALRSMGVPAEPADTAGRTPLPGTASCFVRADAGEIAVGGRKLVGSALLRQHDALLQHGSILVEDDQSILSQLLPSDESPARPAGTLSAALGRIPSFDEVADALLGALRASGPVDASPMMVDSLLAQDVERLQPGYAGQEWTMRY
jgi:lipoate-protein ligase A